jgi:hypothetical protein
MDLSYYDDATSSSSLPLFGVKVKHKYVDPITFSCKAVDFVRVPRIEDSSYETTTDFAFSRRRRQPGSSERNADANENTSSHDNVTNRVSISSESTSGTPPPPPPSYHDDDDAFLATPRASSNKKKKKKKRNKSSDGDSGGSLGAFLQRDKIEKMKEDAVAAVAARILGVDDDHRSVGSRSIGSRSVSDRSYAERSKAEESLAKKTKERRSKRGKDIHGVDDRSLAMMSIDETSVDDCMNEGGPTKPTTYSPSPAPPPPPAAAAGQHRTSFLGLFLTQKGITDTSSSEDDVTTKDDNGDSGRDLESVMSASTLGSKSNVSALSKAEQSIAETNLKGGKRIQNSSAEKETDVDVKNDYNDDVNNPTSVEDDLGSSLNMEDIGPVVKQLRFRDEDSERYFSQELTDSMYGDLFWTEEELAEMRYEAFLEEIGLDVNEYR